MAQTKIKAGLFEGIIGNGTNGNGTNGNGVTYIYLAIA